MKQVYSEDVDFYDGVLTYVNVDFTEYRKKLKEFFIVNTGEKSYNGVSTVPRSGRILNGGI